MYDVDSNHNDTRSVIVSMSRNPQWLLYVFVLMVVAWLVCRAILLWKVGFWYYQPVFHVYDVITFGMLLGGRGRPGFVIRSSLPVPNRYTNRKAVVFSCFQDVSDIQRQQLVHFLVRHFHRQGNNQYVPTMASVWSTLASEPAHAYVSWYQEPRWLQRSEDGTTVAEPHQEIRGMMTSRPGWLYSSSQSHPADTSSTPLYYVDFLCVHRDYRKQNIAPQLIQTHEYHQRHRERTVAVSLFKREGHGSVMTGLVPLVSTVSICFDAHSHWQRRASLPPRYVLNEGSPRNIPRLVTFVEEQWMQTKHPRLLLSPALPLGLVQHWNAQVEAGTVFLRFLVDSETEEVEALYCFKASSMLIDRGHEALTCFASFVRDPALRVDGFHAAVTSVRAKHSRFGYVVVEDLGDNQALTAALRTETPPCVVSPTAFFLYNYAMWTQPAGEVAVLF